MTAVFSIPLPSWRRHLGGLDDGFRWCARLLVDLGFVLVPSGFCFLSFLSALALLRCFPPLEVFLLLLF